LTTQYHPEMPADFMAALLNHLERKVDPATVARARAQAQIPLDAALFMRWVVQFLELPRRALSGAGV
jgi:hypothetical protein